ncbi:hypothetical protein PILCRDRAFT_829625 [Piloderma croceum F 1598]|uniref:Protein kinase domain-containing protein n=1 Tax=Piloderma croceum (strain F 1598) TaxID=765440 RepID=A0A0C3EY70_PILCF|nr:hypothetical protein PILCRDRAFT_829625 [Piloderma croceum F 1598]
MKHIKTLGGPLYAEVEKYLLKIAEGLKYLHSKSIVHGDLKGNHVLIDQDRHACLADFGLTGWADATQATSTSNHAEVSDVYAFACVSVESYTGKYPFYDIPRDPTVILKVMQGERLGRPACSIDRIMSNELWGLVNAC